MKKKQLLAAVLAAASLTWASSGAPADAYPMLFPNTGYSYVGDTMPFYDGKEFRIFYLEDIRNEPIIDGFHPWSLFTTPDFLDYRHNSRIIPFPKKEYAKDFALGTGSVTQGKNGLYHAFYTGFNWRTHPKENIMHATSSDMVHWQKIPEDTFKGDAMYLHDDFRDPNVFYNKDYGEYWMTITTRMSKGNKPRGIIALYTSQDLKIWANQGVLYAYDEKSDCNLECSTLVKYGDWWYLTFSDQWPDRLTHYRMAKDSKGPFEQPAGSDTFDAQDFYAGKLVAAKGNLYLTGWAPTKFDENDKSGTQWAGNMVTHQLKQRTDGTLYPEPVESAVSQLAKPEAVQPIAQSGAVAVSGSKFSFTGTGRVVLPELKGLQKITGRFTLAKHPGKFGFMFGVEGTEGALNLVFDPAKQQVAFYNTDTAKVLKGKPELTRAVTLNPGESYDFTLLVDGTVATLYINGQTALTTRMYGLPEHPWGVFSEDGAVTLTDLQMHTM